MTAPRQDRRARPLAVGLVGAGPWAQLVHAPVLARHPRTSLAAVWARRLPVAEQLAAANGARAVERFEDLLDRCDAVSFAVPPDVQAELAIVAARAGKALLLEKPIALELARAEALAAVVEEHRVGSQVLLTWRYTAAVRSFLAAIDGAPIGGRGHFLSGSVLGGPFATPWRLAHGPLADLGPHVVDLLDAALGPVVAVRAQGDRQRWVGLLLEHATGAYSDVSLSASVPGSAMRAGVEVHTSAGGWHVDAAAAVDATTFTTLFDEFVETAAGAAHALDVRRGVHLQRILHDAAMQLR